MAMIKSYTTFILRLLHYSLYVAKVLPLVCKTFWRVTLFLSLVCRGALQHPLLASVKHFTGTSFHFHGCWKSFTNLKVSVTSLILSTLTYLVFQHGETSQLIWITNPIKWFLLDGYFKECYIWLIFSIGLFIWWIFYGIFFILQDVLIAGSNNNICCIAVTLLLIFLFISNPQKYHIWYLRDCAV